jgi:tetratricopeptide (TPR) repeat protein
MQGQRIGDAHLQPGPRAQAVERALNAARSAQTDPALAQQLVRAALAAAPGDAEVTAAAERALGIVAATRGDLAESVRRLRRSARIADRAGLAQRSCEARGTLAYVLILTDSARAALRELDRAAATGPEGVAAARLHMQRGLVLEEMHRLPDAAASFDLALATLQRCGGDAVLEADVCTNRAMVRTSLADWTGARADLMHAGQIYGQARLVGRIAMVQHNLGNLEALRGDLPAALIAFDEAAVLYRQAGLHPGLLWVERAEALLSAGLAAEARAAASAALAEFTAQRNAVDVVQARLVLAEAALLAGDCATARTEAELARTAARRQGRPHWSARAGYLLVRARWVERDRSRSAETAARRSADELDAAGWTLEATDARLVAAQLALSLGRPEQARRDLDRVRAARRSGPAELRARAWHAEALMRRSLGRRAGAAAAVRAGLRILDQFQAGLGATDMRTHAAMHAGELARLGLELAVESGRATAILGAAERGRAGALRFRSGRPPDDARLVAALAALREVIAELGSGRGEPAALLARRASIENEIRDRARHATGPGRLPGQPDAAQLTDALGDAVLVEYLDLDGELVAVIVSGGQVRFQRLGRTSDAEREIHAFRAALQWLTQAGESSAAALHGLADRAAHELDDLLLRDLLPDARAPLVVVPTGALHALPWSGLPSCTTRAISVSPSAALWHRAATTPSAEGRTVLAYGPALRHAEVEVAAVARVHPAARRLGGEHASVAAVLAALDGAAVAHLATHGRFRSDNPMFSELQLADGPLTIYDLETLPAAPRLIVLAACDSARAHVASGDELIGLSAALLGLGTTALIATVVPVPDDASRVLMTQFHRHLAEGCNPASALANARQGTLEADPSAQARVAAAAYVCLGAG